MSNATKCDRCGSCYEHGGRSIRQGFGSDMEEFDLCADCAEAFDAWMERGQMADASEGIVMARVFGVDDATLDELTDECAELRKYRDEWKGLAEKYRADSIAAQAETERYRAKLGDVLDALHEAERAVR